MAIKIKVSRVRNEQDLQQKKGNVNTIILVLPQ